MTFSIVARSSDGLAHGVAVASKFLAAGAVVPAAQAGVGALATQSYANLAYRPQGLTLLGTQVAAAEVVAGLTAADPGRDQRQLGVVGKFGEGATYTGPACHEWAGGVAGDGYAVQGNILTGPEVVDAMRDAFLASEHGTPGDSAMALARRLVRALSAGDAAGGDRRGRQSAAVYVVAPGAGYGGTSDVAVDLRVDDHPDPCGELSRLLDLHALLFEKADPDSLLDLTGDLAEEVRALLADRGHADADLDVALADWAGIENLEERMIPGRIDPLVLAHLREKS
ncbi:MAG: DUF1028 domain-containing protein [Hamadaea sp.]|uniref:DUF1028 domain-containing protein n=1 Tax=Hamadaea sp. NPDC050747 TaxID=3155789 RepID=UPI0017B5DA2E|nr:DUF1028 domain-containing protein [Hamadaea sp.]NUR47095.1 DUF1028 domain-containing protein [Hamadaea sp.]NUT07386.1 DUF1028 domain-containing protein [Hamadaea sp.]